MASKGHKPDFKLINGGPEVEAEPSVEPFSADHFLKLVRSGLRTGDQRRDWVLFSPLYVSAEVLERIGATLRNSGFELLDPKARGVTEAAIADYTARMLTLGVPDLCEHLHVGDVPHFKSTIGGQEYPTFSVGLSKNDKPCVSTGYLKCLAIKPTGHSKMTHVLDLNFKPLPTLPPWTFFIDRVGAH